MNGIRSIPAYVFRSSKTDSHSTASLPKLSAFAQVFNSTNPMLSKIASSRCDWFGIKSLRSAFKSQSLDAGEGSVISKSKIVATCLALTFLNPHVYLDTVILLGSIANQFEEDRWFFAIGGAVASVVWFSAIGFGARAASRFMSKPIFWKILDSIIATVMFTIAITLAFYKF